MSSSNDQLLHYIEDFGLARTAGRMLGWLLVCNPSNTNKGNRI